MNLDELRKRIDALDTEILRCLNERARCALEIGDIKRLRYFTNAVQEGKTEDQVRQDLQK